MSFICTPLSMWDPNFVPLQPVGFIGLGNMGLPMAQNLISRGQQLILYDLSPERVGEVGGGDGVNSPAEVAKRTKTIVTMLPSGENVMECFAGDNGILRWMVITMVVGNKVSGLMRTLSPPPPSQLSTAWFTTNRL